MIKLVLADMDNTLIPLGHMRASDRTLEAIHACLDAGIVFAPASGRNRAEVAGFLGHDEAAYQTAVLVNGQQVYLRGRLIREVTLDAEALAQAEEIVHRHAKCALFVYRPDGFCDWTGDDPETLANYMVDAIHNGSERHEVLPRYPVVKAGIAALAPREESQALVQELADACPELSLMGTDTTWFDIVPRGWSKVRGIQVLEEELGITPHEICAFGDAENDVLMFEHVGHPCAVANATPEALSAARWKVGASEDDGVAIALEQLAAASREASSRGHDVLPAFMR